MNNKQQPQQLKININDLEHIECEGCKGDQFEVVWILHKVPAMLSQTGKVSIFPVAFYKCVECGKTTNVISGN